MKSVLVQIKSFAVPISVFLLVWGAFFFLFAQRFTIGVNQADVSCLQVNVLLVDTSDTQVEQGELVLIRYHKNLMHLEKGARIGKLVAGVPGDEITFSQDMLLVNGMPFTQVSSMRPLLNYLQTKITDYQTTYKLADDEYFLVGDTIQSFDSRYWGPVKATQIIGQAYAIF